VKSSQASILVRKERGFGLILVGLVFFIFNHLFICGNLSQEAMKSSKLQDFTRTHAVQSQQQQHADQPPSGIVSTITMS
jgi:hypothetical protein